MSPSSNHPAAPGDGPLLSLAERAMIPLICLLTGGWMLADGVYVLLAGKYMGPEKPGPWSGLFEFCGINPFDLGPLFIVFGISWLSWCIAFLVSKEKRRGAGLILSALTLWYAPVGTALALLHGWILLRTRRSKTIK